MIRQDSKIAFAMRVTRRYKAVSIGTEKVRTEKHCPR